MNPHQVTKDFERAVAEYTGAPYCVAVNSCTNALFLCLMWFQSQYETPFHKMEKPGQYIEIPKRTYVSVPMQILHAGYAVRFRDEDWLGQYQLKSLPIWDSARFFTSGMYHRHVWLTSTEKPFICTSHHWSKTLGIQQGGCILHDSPEADVWFRRARFDGRTEGVQPRTDRFEHLGWHMYLSPEIAAHGLVRLKFLPLHNQPLPNDDYPDLSELDLFK